MAPEIEKLEEIVLQLRCGEVLNLDESADLLDDAIREIERLREGLRLITCEPINAEYMAQNILDGLPAYHDTMLVPNEPPNAKLTGDPQLHRGASSERSERVERRVGRL